MGPILERALSGSRIEDEEWLELWQRASLFDLGRVAHGLRLNRSDPDKVTFIIDRNINYTNICISGCAFCAFYREDGSSGGYVLPKEELLEKIGEAKKLGASQILLQGGLHPELGLEYYTDLLWTIKDNFDINVHGFSPPEIWHIAGISGAGIEEVISELSSAGLDSIPGGGAEILDDEVREIISPHKINASDWLDVMRVAHKRGLNTTATMMFGTVETELNLLNHLRSLRDLQDETEGFTAFIPWCFQPENTSLSASYLFSEARSSRNRGVPGYLKILAMSRIYLDNIDNIQVSWVTMGAKVAQVALFFGANDFGSLMIEENVVKAAGVDFRLDLGELVDAVRGAGFIPAVRNTAYKVLYYP